MAANALARITLLALAVGLTACGGKQKDEAADAAVDLATIRARRDSIRKEAVRDSLDRARYTACSDSVVAALAKAAKASKKKKPATPAADGMIPPEVLATCGKPPAAGAPVAQTAPSKPDSAGARKDTTKIESAAKPSPPPAQQQPAKPALTPQQQQVMRADSIRQAKERAKQDSIREAGDRARQDSLVRAQRDSARGDSLRVARETEVLRETFTYGGGSRDPFASLITEDKIGPEFNDLLLVGVYLDLRRASNSVAVLRDKTNQKRYKLRVGDRLGRLKVAQIRQTDVVFTVEDIGFERQETLSLRKREEQTP